ncbi:MAG: hypothetical protein ACJARP_002064 [Vicingaceae bacterium]|jgi:hypothetical protein
MSKQSISISALILLISISFSSVAQKVPDYYAELLSAQRLFIAGDYQRSIDAYKQLLEKHNYPFIQQIKEAASIAYLTGNVPALKEFLNAGIKSGMNQQELLYLSQKYKSDSSIVQLLRNYDQHKQEYTKNHDSTLIIKLLNLDEVEEDINTLDYKAHRSFYPPSVRNKIAAKFEDKQAALIDEFAQLVEEYGFPDEKRIGFGGTAFPLRTSIAKHKEKNNYRTCTTFKVTYYTEHLLKKKNKTLISCEPSRPFRNFWSIPGGYYMFHALSNKNAKKNDELLTLLQNGYKNLQLSRYFYFFCHELIELANSLEKNGHLQQNVLKKADFAVSIKSPLLLNFGFGKNSKNIYQRPNDPELKVINEHRAKYGYRTIPEDIQLIQQIYLLTKGEKPDAITEEVLMQVSPYFYFFLN